MSLLVLILVVLVVLALVLYGVQLLPFPDATVKAIIMCVCVLIAAIVIAQRAGLA